MSNPYLSFINSIGGSTGSHSTLQKLAASSSPSTSSVTTTTTATTTSSTSRTHASSSRPTTAPRLQEKPTSSSSSASKHSRHGPSSYSHSHSNSYSSSHSPSQSNSYSRPSTSASKPRSSSSHHHSSSYSNGSHSRDYKSSSSSSNGNSNSNSSNNRSSSRNHDRADSKNYGHDQDRRHSNGSKSHVSSRDTSNHRDERDGRDARNGDGSYHAGSRNERKRERDVDTGRSDDPRGYARAPKDKDASFSEPRAKKRHARSRSRTPSRTRSRSRSRSWSRSPSRTGTKYRQRSYSPRRRPAIKSRSRSRSRSSNRSPSPMKIVKDSKPTAPPAPTAAPIPVLPQPKPPAPTAPLPVATPIRTSTPPPPLPPQQQQRSYLDLDDTSSFSTLSSPSSYSLSPPPRSVPSSPAKDLSPIKKRRMESLLQAEASYSSPSSLSSLSPEPSDRSSSERELEEGEMSLSPAKEEGTNTTAQDRPKRVTEGPPKKESASQQALELELFGKILSKPKINSTTIATTETTTSTTSTKKAETSRKSSSINGGKQDSTLERKPTSTSSIAKVKLVEDTDEEEYGSLGSIVKDEPSLDKQSNGHLGVNGKRSSLDNVRTSREIVTINTQKGTVTSKTVKIFQKPPKPSNGTAIQRPSKSSSSVNTSKESSQKHSSSSTAGAASRRMSILHSDQIVAAAMGRYKNHFHMLVEDSDSTVASNPSSTGGDSMHVSVEYPGKDSREKFTLMKPFLSRSKTESDDKDEYNPIEDLVQTVRIIMEHFFTPEQYKELFGTASEGLHRSLTKYKNRKDGAQFLKAVEEFNQIMRKEKSLGVIQDHVRQYGHRLPYDLVVHLLQQVYSRTVAARASKLNQYEAFSNNVYGEILPILTKEFIQRTKMDEGKVFVDLGCGIGNVVLQVALQTGAESYGVEIMDTPAKFAKKQAREFEARTRAFGLNHGAVSMIHGDFLDTPGLAGILARADVVLVNNYAFNSALNQSLLQLFLDLKEGCKIISLKTFVSLDHKINVRNAGSVESILRVKKYPYYTNAVSWTHNGGEYFIATVDRSAVQAFWERAMSDGGASLDDGGSRRSSTRRR